MKRDLSLLVFVMMQLASGQEMNLRDILPLVPNGQSLPAVIVEAKTLPDQRNRKIDPSVRLLLLDSRSRSAGDLAEDADNLGVHYTAGKVAVTVGVSQAARLSPLAKAITALGGEVTGSREGVLFARVPLNRIESLDAMGGVEYLGRQDQFYPVQSHEKSDASPTAQTASPRSPAMTGRGVKIGILDFGFRGYAASAAAGRVPRASAQRAFGNAPTATGEVDHGTLCAEIIHRVAPEAKLYLASVDGQIDQIDMAVAWLAVQGVEIINFSGGGHSGPSDGRAMLDRIIDDSAARRHILWVVAAGNDGDRHWVGQAVDHDGDGWIDVGQPGQNMIALRPRSPFLKLLVNWDDWGGDPLRPASTQDIDAYLFRFDPESRKTTLVAKSVNPQNGFGPPLETIGLQVQPGQIYLLGLKATRITRPVRVHVYGLTSMEMYPVVKQASLSSPATAHLSIAVGAVNPLTGDLESFSSQGPTDDNRMKPELTASDRVLSTPVVGENAFIGTSASCPYVAGYAALLRQTEPVASGTDLRGLLMRSLEPRGQPTPNNQFGAGYLDLEKLGPSQRSPTQFTVSFTIQILRDNSWEVVDPSHRFQTGDRLQFKIRSSAATHLYVFSRTVRGAPDSLGSYLARRGIETIRQASRNREILVTPYKLLFPNTEAGVALLPPQSTLTVPGRDLFFSLDTDPGIEKVYIVATPRPLEPALLSRIADPDTGRLLDSKLIEWSKNGVPIPSRGIYVDSITNKSDSSTPLLMIIDIKHY